MSFSVANLGTHMLAWRSLLARKPVQIAIAVATLAILLSIILAPDTSPTTWDWVRIIVIGVSGAAAILTFITARTESLDTQSRQQRLIAAAVFFGIALILNLTFSFGTTIIFSIGVTVLALIAASERDLRSSWMMTGALIALVPFWVWSALDAWTGGLLLLLPFATIAIISDGHMRAAVGLSEDRESLLSPRAHRLASWAGILGMALIVLITGLLTDASNGVVTLGAVGAMVLIAIEAGAPQSSGSGPRRAVAIADAALVWVALCWIVSL